MTKKKTKDLKVLAQAFFAHLTLSHDEFGAIGLDCKRPFGNSFVEGDILELLGARPEGADGDWSSAQVAYAYELYQEDLIPFLQNAYLTDKSIRLLLRRKR
jgi:hypothetical protein